MKLTLLALLISVLTACAGLERKQPQSLGAGTSVSRADLDQTYLEAQLYIFAGNLGKARSVLELSLSKELPADSSVEFERMLSRVEASSGETEEAFKRLTLLSRRFPENTAVLSDLAQFLYGIQFKEKAYEAYSKLTVLVPEHSNYWIYRGLLALELSEVKDAWDSFDHLIRNSKDAKHLGHLYMGKLLQMTNFSKKAEREFRRCLRIDDTAKECALELAVHMQKLGRPKKAFKFLETYISRHKLKASIPVLNKLLEWSLLMKSEERVSHYVEILERLKPSDISLKRRAALIFMERQDFQSAKERLSIVVNDKGANVQDISTYLNLLTLMNLQDEKMNFFEQILQSKKLDEKIFFQKYKLESKVFGSKQAEKRLKKSCAFQKANLSPCSYVYSFVLFESGRLRQAKKNLERQVASKDEVGSLKLKYFLSQIYLKEGSRKKAMAMLDRIILEDRTYSPALNFKAYTLLETSGSLKEAEDLSLRALAVQPQNGHYLDTYGWILFNKGMFQEAVVVLTQAFEMKPGEPEISEHLADAFAAVGDNSKAEKFYKLASKLFKGENNIRVDRKLANIQKIKRSISSAAD